VFLNFRRLPVVAFLATINGVEVQIGSGTFVTTTSENDNLLTTVHIKIGEYLGRFLLQCSTVKDLRSFTQV
jgi:hypothetical protein